MIDIEQLQLTSLVKEPNILGKHNSILGKYEMQAPS